ncbi:MAG: hypothetical protein ACHQQ3_10505 [Gemmatimonadales bacterium]
MRKMLAGLALAVFASAASAQGGGGMPGMQHDDTKSVKQVGPHPTGWLMRVDSPAREKEEDANFVTMGPGMHVTAGPHATYWNPENTASGTYTISAQFGVRSTPMHDYVGLIWGGSEMGTDKVSYAYFLVGGDGSFLVKHRAGPSGASARSGNPDVHTVIDKTSNAAIKQAMKDGAPADGGSASNTLEVRVASDSVRFVINGTQVGAADAKSPMMPTSGIYGFRVNHNIDTHIGAFGKK